jgi:hypothetical protein
MARERFERSLGGAGGGGVGADRVPSEDSAGSEEDDQAASDADSGDPDDAARNERISPDQVQAQNDDGSTSGSSMPGRSQPERTQGASSNRSTPAQSSDSTGSDSSSDGIGDDLDDDSFDDGAELSRSGGNQSSTTREPATEERFGDSTGVAKDIERDVDRATGEVADRLEERGEQAEEGFDERAEGYPEGPPGSLGPAGTSRAAGEFVEAASNTAADVAQAPSTAIEGGELAVWLAEATPATGGSREETAERVSQVGAAAGAALLSGLERASENPTDAVAQGLVGFALGGAAGSTAARAARAAPDSDTVRAAGGRFRSEFSGTDRGQLGPGRNVDRGDSVEADGDQLMLTREETDTREAGDLTDAEREAIDEMELDEEQLEREFSDVPDEDARDADPTQPGEIEGVPDDLDAGQTQDLRTTSDADSGADIEPSSADGPSLDQDTVELLRREFGDDAPDTRTRGDTDSDADTTGTTDVTDATDTGVAAGAGAGTIPIGATNMATGSDTDATPDTDQPTATTTDAEQDLAVGTTATGDGTTGPDGGETTTDQPTPEPPTPPAGTPGVPPFGDGFSVTVSPSNSDPDRRRRRRRDLDRPRRRRRRDSGVEETVALLAAEEDQQPASTGGRSDDRVLPGYAAETLAVFAGADPSAPSQSSLREDTDATLAAIGEYPTSGLMGGLALVGGGGDGPADTDVSFFGDGGGSGDEMLSDDSGFGAGFRFDTGTDGGGWL